MTKDEILLRMQALGFTRQSLAAATGYKYEYVRDRLVPTAAEPSPKFIAAVERAFSEEERRCEVLPNKTDAGIWDLVYFSGSEVERIDRARKIGGYPTLPALYRDAVIQFTDTLLDAEKKSIPITPISPATAKPHLQAAAGSPILSEVTDWDGADNTVRVRINGLSMEPQLHDGEVITMRHKRASRSPWMKKGLIYLVEYDGGYTVKRYNTRRAHAEEIGQDWTEDGKVKVLESLNPEFPEIIIKQPVEWVAWLDSKLHD